MPWIAHYPLMFLVKVALMFGLVMAAPRACDRARPVRPAWATSSWPSAIILFGREDVEPEIDALSSLDAAADLPWSDLMARVQITGFANERHSLLDNIGLAEERARFLTEQLTSRGVLRRQMVAAAVESSPGDGAGSRCHVKTVAPPNPLITARMD